jgi:hypothetical protein
MIAQFVKRFEVSAFNGVPTSSATGDSTQREVLSAVSISMAGAAFLP